jgi:aspartate ammonia-lyase
MDCRIEHDFLGEMRIDNSAYWGIHTQRALENFPMHTSRVPENLIHAIALVKKAACEANAELGYIDKEKASAIIAACEEIAAGKHDAQFPIDALQGGAGTSANMNVNEVVANISLETLGRKKGDYGFIHPIEHVNMHQSTNDVYPTALKIAAIVGVRTLSAAIEKLQSAMQDREKEFSDIVIIGRTELQAAVPITLGAQFSSFAEAFARDRWRTFKCEERLRMVNIGGTAVGTGMTAPKSYIFLVIEKLRRITSMGLSRAENPIDQTANSDAFIEVAGMINAFAVNCIKICNDIRLLHFSGEIILPPRQAGSSIMPGKINPVVCEAGISAGIKIKSLLSVVTDTASMGTFQINEFLPILASSLLEALHIAADTCGMLVSGLNGMKADREICRKHTDGTTALVTAFLPAIGYEKAQAFVNEFNERKGTDFRAFLNEKLGIDIVDKTLSVQSILSLGYREQRQAH